MSRELEGKVALVTGGSRGIGREISVELARCGAHVIVNYAQRSQAAEETVTKCQEVGGTASILGFNVAESGAVDEAFATIKDEHGRLDILVNNAGITRDGLILRMKNDDWDQVIATNLNGTFYCCRSAAKLMMKARVGRIINISSVVGEMGNPGQANYVASKSAVLGLTKSLAKELGSRGITVNAVTPGFIETDMTADLDEQVKQSMLANIPLGRFGSPQEVAKVVAFLASSGGSYITGQILGINGGLHM
jgi:3-oxoacyl-[acyl-carrier protein] reductase